MRKAFSEYYTPAEAEFNMLWQEAVFVLDTNMLLHIYEYGDKTREWLFKILKRLGELDRLWIPYHVGKEYHDDRLGVISKQRRYYEDVTKKLTEASNVIDSAKRKHHPFLDPAELIKQVQDAINTVQNVVTKAKENHPDYYDGDPLHERLTQLLEGKVGTPTPLEKLTDIYKEGDRRYKAETPPGFKDQNQKEKPFPKNHGDYVIWCQIIEFAKAKKKPIIFITDDEKEDWWRLHNDRTIGPRPELREEMRTAGGVSFYMYKGDAFIDRALTQFLQADEQDKTNAVEEAKAVREKQEVREELPPGAAVRVGGMFPVASGYLDVGIRRTDPASGMTWQPVSNYEPQMRRAAQIAQMYSQQNQDEAAAWIAVLLYAQEQQKRVAAFGVREVHSSPSEGAG